MVNLPISDYVKNYYREHNIVLSDFTQAVIIDSMHQEWLSWSKKLSMLREIANTTKDKRLKLQIMDHIEDKLGERAWFMDNRKGKYRYSVDLCGSFDTFDQALEAGKHSSEPEICIEKYDVYISRRIHYEASVAAKAIWNKEGNTLLQLHSYTKKKKYHKNTYGKRTRFDCCKALRCEFPFERGDIVRNIRTGEVGVLQTSRSDWAELVRKAETEIYQRVPFDNEVLVRTVGSYGGTHLCDSGNYILHLEKITEAESGMDGDIMRCIVRLMKEGVEVTKSTYHVEAERKIGIWFYYGDGVTQNDDLAFSWLRYAAGNKDTEARYFVGKLYAEGRGVAQDYAKALNWYLFAARDGHVESQYEVGRYYADGIGVPIKRKKAVEWFQKAADQGHEEARLRLEAFMMDEI